MPETIENN